MDILVADERTLLEGMVDRQRDEILWLEVVNMRLATRACERLRLEREDAQVVRDPAPAEDRCTEIGDTGDDLGRSRRELGLAAVRAEGEPPS